MSESLQWVHIYTFAIHVFGLSFAVSSVENVLDYPDKFCLANYYLFFPHTHTEFLNEHTFVSNHMLRSFSVRALAGLLKLEEYVPFSHLSYFTRVTEYYSYTCGLVGD